MIKKSIVAFALCFLVIGTTGFDDMVLLTKWGNFSKASDLVNKSEPYYPGVSDGEA